MSRPATIPGGVHVDARDPVRHVKDFYVGTANNFYMNSPSYAGERRACVGHRRNWKWFFAAVDDPAKGGYPTVSHVRPADRESQLLNVTPSFATAIQAYTLPASHLVLSTGCIEAAAEDNFQFHIGSPTTWHIEPLAR